MHRTPENRHWIQLLIGVGAGANIFKCLDLAMVDSAEPMLGENPDDPQDKNYCEAVKIYYAGELKPINFGNVESSEVFPARDFWRAWEPYAAIKFKSEPGIESQIVRPNGKLII